MQCLNPTQAWIVRGAKTKKGRKVIVFNLPRDGLNPIYVNLRYQPLDLPCGKCILCKKRRAFQVGVRALKEAACYDSSVFITLTVSDDHLQQVFPGGRLCHAPFQLFMKRLRKRLKKKHRVRFLMCGEYGEHTHRPHYHAILFGLPVPSDQYFDERGCFHASRMLEEVWPFGNVRCDRLNENRVFYVAGYQLKDDPSGAWPSYVKWSRRPGLGADWFDRFWRDMYVMSRDSSGERTVESSIVFQRRQVPFSCRYFDERLFLHDEVRYDILRACREKVGSSFDPSCANIEVQKFMLKVLLNKVDVIKARLAKRTRDLKDPVLCDIGLSDPLVKT